MPDDARYEDRLGENARPGGGGTTPGVGGSHGAAEDGVSGYRGAAEANVMDDVSGNPDKTTYTGTPVESATTTNPTVYRDPSVDPAARIEQMDKQSEIPGGGTAPDGGPDFEPIQGQTDSPGTIDPAQKMTDTKGVAPVPTVDPTVGVGSMGDPTSSNRML